MRLIDVIELLPDSDIPCNGCTTCCYGAVVPLLEDEDFPSVEVNGQRVLPHNDEGNCIYLTDTGCEAWPDSPASCRTYDCVMAAKVGLEHREEVIRVAHKKWAEHDTEVPEVLTTNIDLRI
jgi:hypothetical protein